MKEVILYISASLDGYIADSCGRLDFLPEIPETGYDYGYKKMYESIDVIIMGRTTYDYISAYSQHTGWPYVDKKCYIYTHHTMPVANGIECTDTPPKDLLEHIWNSGAKRVWLMGGGEIIRLFMQHSLIDVFDIFYVPVLLGGGMPLFPQGFPQTELQLEKTDSRGELLEVIYRKKI